MPRIIHFSLKKLKAERRSKQHKEEGFVSNGNKTLKQRRLALPLKGYSKKGKKMPSI